MQFRIDEKRVEIPSRKLVQFRIDEKRVENWMLTKQNTRKGSAYDGGTFSLPAIYESFLFTLKPCYFLGKS